MSWRLHAILVAIMHRLEYTSDQRPSYTIMMAALAAFISIITYIATTIKAAISNGGTVGTTREPLLVPYWLPGVGNLLSWMLDTHSYVTQLAKQYGLRPFRVRLLNQKFYCISSPDDIAAFFKANWTETSLTTTVMVMKYVAGAPESVIQRVYGKDDSGISARPLPGSKVQPEKRFYHLHHRLVVAQMSGRRLQGMTARFIESLERQLHNLDVSRNEWTAIPDLHRWLGSIVFRASVESICGTQIFNVNPTLAEDFREFYQAVPDLLKGLPRFVTPKAYAARARMLSNLKNWNKAARQHLPLNTAGPGWDEWWGCEFVKKRKDLYMSMDGMDEDGMASDDLILLFVTNVNIVPAVSWMIIEAIRTPSLLPRVLPDIEAAFCNGSIDINKACNNTLLQSIYAETLRLHTINMLSRHIHTDEQPLKGWRFPKKAMVFLLGNVAAFDNNVWNTGTKEHPHPVEEFWPERFLVYPDDDVRGASRLAEMAKSSERGSDGPTFSLAGLAGAWVPYGGGESMCPGRNFAKQEMIGSFTMLNRMLQLELTGGDGAWYEGDKAFFFFGTMPPKGQIPAKVRRRKL